MSSLSTEERNTSMPPSTASADVTSQRQRREHKKSVHFDSCVQGVQVPSLEGVSARERQRIWHSREEFEEIGKGIRNEARYMRLSHTARSLDSSGTLACTEDEIWCSRGIEHLLSKKILLKLDRRKQKVIKSILDEQFHQQLDGTNDPNRIADISQHLSAEAKKRAINLANDDAFYLAEEHGLLPRPSNHFRRRAQQFLNDAKTALENDL